MKAVLYTTRAISGREGPNICRHFSIMEQFNSVDFLTYTWSDKSSKAIKRLSNLSINKNLIEHTEFYKDKGILLSDWEEVYRNLNVESLSKYDAIVMIGGLDFHNSYLGRNLSRVGKFPKDRGHMKWISMAVQLVNILAMLKAHRTYGIPFHEVAFDPNEMSCDLFNVEYSVNDNYYLYHGYDVPKFNMKRLDSLQYYFNKKSPSLFSPGKNIDFTFGYTILDDSKRKHYPAYIQEVARNFKEVHIHLKNEFTGENTLIPGNDYLQKIKRTKYTYMLPSYNIHCFSIYRFIESISNDCLPLIHPDCNIQDVSKSFDVDFSVLMRNKPFSENDRIEVLQQFKDKVLPFVENFKGNIL